MAAVVSIITPLFNAEKYIHKTHQSIQDQTFNSWEWIVVDDGSNDNSFQLVSDFAQQDERISVCKRQRDPKSASTCRNIGLTKTTGEYVVFLDADDLLAPNCLQERVSFFKQNPNNDFCVFSSASFVEEEGEIKIVKELQSNQAQSDLENFLRFNYPWSIIGPIWKRKSLSTLNGFDESFQRLQDPEIHIRAILNGLVYSKSPVLNSYYRLTFKGVAFPDKAKTQKIYEGYRSFIQKILIPHKKKLSQEPYLKHIKFSFSGTIRNYLLHYAFYSETKQLSKEMRANGFISSLEFKCILTSIAFNKLGLRSKYLNKLILLPLER